jgi:hypothetical protein
LSVLGILVTECIDIDTVRKTQILIGTLKS